MSASTAAVIESGHADPAFSTLERMLAAAGLETRVHLEPVDDHDAALDAIERLRSTGERKRVAAARFASRRLWPGRIDRDQRRR